ncbi:MAG: FAD-binding protein [Deltaproteobacteria bacterium]|nr:FAD-binding protein [Deltaproteobacteria bacterium]
MDPLDRATLALERALGPSVVDTDPTRCEPFARDESEAEGVTPRCVVHARTSDDVSVILRHCEENRVPVFPRAAGTGRSGGATAVVPGVVLDLRALSQVKELDRENLLAVVEPGVVTGTFHALVEAEGLFYPPDPQSAETCTLGGNAAENAGGPRAFKYGVTREYVLGLEAVTMGGERLRAGRRTAKGVTGYDVTGLLVGSEGTLAVFTELTLRLVPQPPLVCTLQALFATVDDAGRAVTALVGRRLVPRCLELLDTLCCQLLREAEPSLLPPGDCCMLLLELDGEHPEALERDASRLADACLHAGARSVHLARDEAERARLWAVRKRMSRALRARAASKLSEDVVGPRTRVPELLSRARAISERHRVVMPAYGHAGDGNLHVNFLWDDPADKPRVERAIEALFRATLDLGGTLSGEHGIGVLKAPFLPWEQSPALIAMQQRLKSVFDPSGCLNPGKIFPRPGHLGC